MEGHVLLYDLPDLEGVYPPVVVYGQVPEPGHVLPLDVAMAYRLHSLELLTARGARGSAIGR